VEREEDKQAGKDNQGSGGRSVGILAHVSPSALSSTYVPADVSRDVPAPLTAVPLGAATSIQTTNSARYDRVPGMAGQ